MLEVLHAAVSHFAGEAEVRVGMPNPPKLRSQKSVADLRRLLLPYLKAFNIQPWSFASILCLHSLLPIGNFCHSLRKSM